jgi:hypothetical protein
MTKLHKFYSIFSLGDISFVGLLPRRPSEKVFSEVSHLWSTADLVIGNLECVLSSTGTPVSGKCAWMLLKKQGYNT